MKAALKAITDGPSVSRAAMDCRIPNSFLFDHASSKVTKEWCASHCLNVLSPSGGYNLCFVHCCTQLMNPSHLMSNSVFAPLEISGLKFAMISARKFYNFSCIFSEAWNRSVVLSNVMAWFRRAGVYPFNPKATSVTERDFVWCTVSWSIRHFF